MLTNQTIKSLGFSEQSLRFVSQSRSRGSALRRWAGVWSAAIVAVLALGCGGGGGSLADTGGMSGTGISQGSISSFGSIFVNGVEWDISGAVIEIDGSPASEADLRLGMIVRVAGDFDAGNATGTALDVRFDDSIEGPIETIPIETILGVEKSFTILGQTVVVRDAETVFDGGATFTNLAADEVVEVSGFVDRAGAIQATRVERKAASAEVEFKGIVANLLKNADGTGVFDLGSIVVRYTADTTFSDVTRATLDDGDEVEIEGMIRVSGTEVDADEIELEESTLGASDADRVELEGVVSICPESTDFCVAGVPVDSSGATFDPVGFVPVAGDLVEVEGSLVAGIIVADQVESEDESRNVRIEAEVTSVDPVARTLVILGVTVSADGRTQLEDKSLIGDGSFMFDEIEPGDYLEIRGFSMAGAMVEADSIRREDATEGEDDVRLTGPVTALDSLTPALSILGEVVPVDGMTAYFDDEDNPLTEEEFFRNPGDIMLGDIVTARDRSATTLLILAEADEVEAR